jgi:hypothetical protein
MADFCLKKWYVDIADNAGHVYIGYCVYLKWGHFEINGYQNLWRSPEKGIRTETKVARVRAPDYDGADRLIWQPSGLMATWESAAEPIAETLLETDDGRIIWLCTQPKAQASITSSGLRFSGWGYTECIDITIPVWKLPFRTLYWGRCHTDHHCLVWIKWCGRTNKSLIWFDGQFSQDFLIADDRVEGSRFTLTLRESTPLRQGKIGSTIVRPLGGILKALPRTILSIDERKWYCNGVLNTDSKAEPATTIYEKVSW